MRRATSAWVMPRFLRIAIRDSMRCRSESSSTRAWATSSSSQVIIKKTLYWRIVCVKSTPLGAEKRERDDRYAILAIGEGSRVQDDTVDQIFAELSA